MILSPPLCSKANKEHTQGARCCMPLHLTVYPCQIVPSHQLTGCHHELLQLTPEHALKALQPIGSELQASCTATLVRRQVFQQAMHELNGALPYHRA